MKVLHICNDFCYSKVHSELYKELDKLGVEQVVYAYPMDRSRAENNRFESLNTVFISADVLRSYHRFLFHKKIRDLVADVCRRVDMSTIDCVHATTLFSDGGVAYALHKKYGIPYVVAVRNTDVNEYMVLAPHTWLLGRKVIANANKLVFISPSIYKHFCEKRFFSTIAKQSAAKTVICPNGINEYWLNHITSETTSSTTEILYIGRFDKNKNVLRLIEAFLELRKELPDVHMTIVGERGEQEKSINEISRVYADAISYLGPIYDREELRKIMRRVSVFAMTSIHETFGLVYIEALSQGLPILFTRHQGVDGFFADSIGVAVNPKDTEDIKRGLRELLVNHDKYRGYRRVDFSQFKWEDIARKYKDIIFNLDYELPSPPSKKRNRSVGTTCQEIN